jgi:hypothetical protein
MLDSNPGFQPRPENEHKNENDGEEEGDTE